MRRALEARFPDLEVVGTNYPPGERALLPRQWSALMTLPAAPAKALLARAVSFASTAAVAVTLGGEALFPTLGLRNPDFLKSLQASKLQTCAAAWFIGNTGALFA